MMIGGPAEQVELLDPIFLSLAPGLGSIERTKNHKALDQPWKAENGYVHAGPAGAGHFVKMVHNGIEYGMMQAYAEGFDILKQRAKESLPEDERFELNLTDVAEVWRRGSVISSWLLDLVASALATDDTLSQFSGRVADSGEGRWTIDAAMEEAVPVDVLAASLFARYRSRVEFSFADQLCATASAVMSRMSRNRSQTSLPIVSVAEVPSCHRYGSPRPNRSPSRHSRRTPAATGGGRQRHRRTIVRL